MKANASRDKILGRIEKSARRIREKAKLEEPDQHSPIYHPIPSDMVRFFKEQLEKVNGHAILCADEEELKKEIQILAEEKQWQSIHALDPKLQNLLKDANIPATNSEADFLTTQAGITFCEFLVAHLGSVVVSSKQLSGRRMNAFPPNHLVVAHVSQLQPYLDDALRELKKRYRNEMPSIITNITGPSRTADIEKTLILGAHGPKELFVFILGK